MVNYREAGVDIDAADDAKTRIAGLARGTFNASVLTQIGSFGGMFRPDFSAYRDPVLVSSTDGVGTKIQVARALGVHDTIGYDLVAHCVNDILVQGAVPLFFLDYIAAGKLDPVRVEQIVSGLARACSEFGCPLVGGETAEMPGTYAEDDYDLAGFIVGVVDRDRALTGEHVRPGDQLIGLPSTGLHTNGYSLARRVLFEVLGHAPTAELPELGGSVGAALLASHRSYLKAFEPLIERRLVRALAHITGGGLPGNLPRVLPQGLGARIRRASWEVPALFRLIERGGDVAQDEMYRTFNMGVGMVAVVAPESLHAVEHSLERRGEVSWLIGSVVEGNGVVFE
jgi:phosphoribosylformylglycinamidine cyclo-ligase